MLFPSSVVAVSLTVSGIPSEINFGQEMEVNLLFDCSGCNDSYIRGVFYPNGTNYFGYTQNNSGAWIGTEANRLLYFSILKTDLVESSWSGKLKVKPDPNDSAFNGTGEYLFKLGRYTSANDSSADWSNELSLRIIGPTPAPTQAPTNPPTATATQTATATITSKPTPTRTSTPKATAASTEEPEVDETTDEPENLVVDTNVEVVEATPEGLVAGASDTKKTPIAAIVFIILGTSCLGYVGYMIYNQKHAQEQENS